jgi:hypothetical protein
LLVLFVNLHRSRLVVCQASITFWAMAAYQTLDKKTSRKKRASKFVFLTVQS